MKTNKLWLFAALPALLLSCSSDDGDKEPESDITGTWDATELRVNEDTATEDELYGKAVLDYLTASECTVLTFTFNEDLSVILQHSMNYIEVNVEDGGFDVPCPTESDMEFSTYTYDGETLVYLDENDVAVTVSASLSGNTLILDASDLGITESGGGEFVFVKR